MNYITLGILIATVNQDLKICPLKVRRYFSPKMRSYADIIKEKNKTCLFNKPGYHKSSWIHWSIIIFTFMNDGRTWIYEQKKRTIFRETQFTILISLISPNYHPMITLFFFSAHINSQISCGTPPGPPNFFRSRCTCINRTSWRDGTCTWLGAGKNLRKFFPGKMRSLSGDSPSKTTGNY